MKKEVIIAIIIGFSLGLIITFGIRTAQNSLDNQKALAQKSDNTNSINQSAETIAPGHSVLINSPQPDSVVASKELLISGSTTPNSMVSVLGANDFNSTLADDQGNFSTSVNLALGGNIIVVDSYSTIGEKSQMEVTVVHSPEAEEKEGEDDEK